MDAELPRTLTAAQLSEAVGHSVEWVVLHAKAGRLPGAQVAHPCVAGRLTWRFNLEEAQAAITTDPDLWGIRGIKPGREAPGKRPIPDPPDNHHTVIGRVLAQELGVSMGTLSQLAAAGEVPSVRSGTRYWYNRGDVHRALEQRKQQKAEVLPPDDHHTLRDYEVSAAVGFHKVTLQVWARQGLIPSVMSGRRRWFNLEDTRAALLEAGKVKVLLPAAPLTARTAPPGGHDSTTNTGAPVPPQETPDDHHTMTITDATAHARAAFAPSHLLSKLDEQTVRTWVYARVLPGVQSSDGTVWINPETLVRLVGSLSDAGNETKGTQ